MSLRIYGWLGKTQWNIITKNEDFYSNLNMQDITDENNTHVKIVCNGFEVKNIGEYHDLYVQSDTLMLADVFVLDPSKFLSTSWLVWQATLRNSKVKLDLLTDIDMLLMVEKDIREGLCHCFSGYAKANNKYMKDYDKNKEFSYLKYWNVYNSYGWEMLQKLLVNSFDWIKDTS